MSKNEKLIAAYFAECEENGELSSPAGLALKLGMSTRELLGKRKMKCYAAALQRIERDGMKLALTGRPTAKGIEVLLAQTTGEEETDERRELSDEELNGKLRRIVEECRDMIDK